MRALILAAGEGTRLRPFTNDRPKCLVELDGKSLLERQAGVLRRAGIADIIVVAGYRSDQIGKLGFAMRINSRYADTNMVATLFCAADVMTADSDLVIGYGDIVYEPRVLAALLASGAPVTVMSDRQWLPYWRLRLDDPLTDAETLKLGPSARLLELGKKPRSYDEIEGQYMGLIKIRADHVEHLKSAYAAMDRRARYDGKDFDHMYMTSFLQHLIDHDWDVRVAETDNGWLEVDSVSDLQRYEVMAADGSLAAFCNLRDAA